MLPVIAAATLLFTQAAPALAADPLPKTVELLNAYRAKHGTAPLSLDSEVTRTAQEWADHMAETNDFSHRPNNPHSENLYALGSRTIALDSAAKKALDHWYDEALRYNYNYAVEMTESNINHRVLHFTAMVWKSSTRVGVGLAQSKHGTFVVLNFAEQGNILNHFVANVLPPHPTR